MERKWQPGVGASLWRRARARWVLRVHEAFPVLDLMVTLYATSHVLEGNVFDPASDFADVRGGSIRIATSEGAGPVVPRNKGRGFHATTRARRGSAHPDRQAARS